MPGPQPISELRRLVYRVDGGVGLGLGHLARAAAVTQALGVGREWDVAWAGDGGAFVEAAATEAGASVLRRAAGEPEFEFLERCTGQAEAVVLDRKLPYTGAEIAVLNGRCPVICLDVVCEGMFTAAAAVFPGAHVDPDITADPRWRSSGRLFQGGEWVIIHPRVRAAAMTPGQAPDERVVAVVTGGSDPGGVASRALDWLDGVAMPLTVEVMVGIANPRRGAVADRARRSRHPTLVCEAPEEFPARVARATVAVATFGVTAYELAYLAVPTVLVSHSEENAQAAARFALHGCAIDLGPASAVDEKVAARAIALLLSDRTARGAMQAAGHRLVDGRGAERVAALIRQLVRERSARRHAGDDKAGGGADD